MPTKISAPAFTQTMQLGIVVPDVEAAVRNYESRYGIGGWQIMEMDGSDCENVKLYGQSVDWRAKIAVTMVGNVMWELIEPVSEDDLFGKFLAARGGVGGVHHVAVKTPDYKKVVADHAERGNRPILSGKFSGIDIQYLDSEPEIGVVLEVFSHLPEGVATPD